MTAFTSIAAKHAEARAMGAHDCLCSTNPDDLAAAANRFDLVLVTVNVALDWGALLGTVAPLGRLHVVGAVPEAMKLSVASLMDAQRSVSSSAVGAPATIRTMLEFAARHGVAPLVEAFPKQRINDAVARLKAGQVRYRAVIAFGAASAEAKL